MAEPVRHRQTKGAATDMFDLPSPRHISTLRISPVAVGRPGEGRLTEPTAGAQPARRERLKMPEAVGKRVGGAVDALCFRREGRDVGKSIFGVCSLNETIRFGSPPSAVPHR